MYFGKKIIFLIFHVQEYSKLVTAILLDPRPKKLYIKKKFREIAVKSMDAHTCSDEITQKDDYIVTIHNGSVNDEDDFWPFHNDLVVNRNIYTDNCASEEETYLQWTVTE